MTEFESRCYGISESDIQRQYMQGLSDNEMVVAGILSDCQEMLDMGTGPRSVDHVRKQLNVAKYILFRMLDSKEIV
jgi:hypothetical protein